MTAARGAQSLERALLACPCFAGETLVQTIDGATPISEIEAGTLVLARNPLTGEAEYRRVLRAFVTPSKTLIRIKLLGDDGAKDEIKATELHPFWVDGRGWVHAEGLMFGDEVGTGDGRRLSVVGLATSDETETVYNLEVEGLHTYTVGVGEALVHNSCCGDAEKAALVGVLRARALQGAGFAKDGAPIILDESLTAQGVADALRAQGFNVRAVEEIFGRGAKDPTIREFAQSVGARVLTADRGRQLGEGFGAAAIQVDGRVGADVASLARILANALK